MDKVTLPANRQVGHLRVIRQPRELSIAEYRQLTTDDQLEIVRHATGKQKLDLIIESGNPKRIVTRLHPQELFLTVVELGAESAGELINLANTDQITTMLDLDCWDEDSLSPVISLRWLELILDCGEEKSCLLAEQFEPELLALFLKKHLEVIRGIEVYDDDDSENARRLESLYDIHYHSEDAAKIIGRLLKIWQEQAQESYLLIMEMIRSENLSTLEEEAYGARNNRLLDLGIAPKHEAMNLYAQVNIENLPLGSKKNFKLEAEGLQAPNALLALAEPGNLLAEVFAQGVDHETACELMMLLNRKMSADNIDLSSAASVRESLQEVFDLINLGLEYLSQNDPARATKLFAESYHLHLFQAGYNLLKKQRDRGMKLAESSLYPYFDYPELLFLDSLIQRPARLYQAATDDHDSYLQTIRSIPVLQVVEKRLDQLEALQQLFTEKLRFPLADNDSEEEPPSLSGLLMTAVANAALGRAFAPTPLSRADLVQLKQGYDNDIRALEKLAGQLRSALDGSVTDLEFFINFSLENWDDFFTELDENAEILPFEGFLISQ